MPLHQPIEEEIHKINLNGFHRWKFPASSGFITLLPDILASISLVRDRMKGSTSCLKRLIKPDV